MDGCPINHSGTSSEDPHKAETEKHSQVYKFDLNKGGGTIAAFINGVERQFVIREYFPRLDDEGKVVLALLTKTGFFSGSFYNKITPDYTKSDLFTFFEKLDKNTLAYLASIDDLINFLFQHYTRNDFYSLLVPKELLAQVLYLTIEPLNYTSTVFEEINSRLYLNGGWQHIYNFWSDYINTKRTMLNTMQAHYAKPIAADKPKLYIQIQKLFQKFLDNYSLVIHNQNAYSAIIKGEVDSAVTFLRSIADYYGVTIQDSRRFINAGLWQEQNPGMLFVVKPGTQIYFREYSNQIFGDLVYIAPEINSLLAGCPVRNFALLLGNPNV